jgi:hypothetical protein
MEEWVGVRAGLGASEKIEMSCLFLESNHDFSVVPARGQVTKPTMLFQIKW